MSDNGANLSRSILPIPSQTHIGLTTYDAKDPNAKFPPIEPLRPPKGAPNVLIVLLDDVGFAASGAFGGPCQTPNFEKLASNGLKYNRFHTTALCSPTRQAMLTGRNHHSVGMGGITEIATSAPGYCSILPKDKAPLPMTLKLNGYSTAQFGKCHEVPAWQTSPLGPFDQWPTGGGGFEYFYGFIGGETNQWDPAIYEGTTPIEQPKTAEEGYHFTEDMADKAIAWVQQQRALMPDKPFFVYFAPGACHAPHHVPKEWADKYKGKFDQGWDKLREEILARQKKLGVVPQNAELTKRPGDVQAWDEVNPKMKSVLARQMEVYAGFLEHTDHHIGRLIDTLKDLQILDDTLIYIIIGDNGASAEGTPNGTFNEMLMLNGITGIETPEFLMERIDKFGSPESYNHYAVGWAHAMDTPYQWTKQVASHSGGTRNGTIVHWPNGIKARGEVRSQVLSNAQGQSQALDAHTQTQSQNPLPADPPSSALSAPTGNGWQMDLTPYLWFAGTHGTVGVFGRDASVHSSARDLLSHFDFGIMGVANARYSHFLLSGDLMVELPIGSKASIIAGGDVGGWNATAKLDYQFAGLLNFKVSSKWALNAGYRYLFVDYRSGSGIYNMVTSGAGLGLTYTFKRPTQ
jgi:arylsulfatase A-like enzyme